MMNCSCLNEMLSEHDLIVQYDGRAVTAKVSGDELFYVRAEVPDVARDVLLISDFQAGCCSVECCSAAIFVIFSIIGPEADQVELFFLDILPRAEEEGTSAQTAHDAIIEAMKLFCRTAALSLSGARLSFEEGKYVTSISLERRR